MVHKSQGLGDKDGLLDPNKRPLHQGTKLGTTGRWEPGGPGKAQVSCRLREELFKATLACIASGESEGEIREFGKCMVT